jgi:hypothetical protein
MKLMISAIHPLLCPFTVAMLALVPASIRAALVQTNVSNPNEQFYAADCSSSDLINGLTPSAVTGWQLHNGAEPSKLNDGVHGASGLPVQGAWTFAGATVTYDLGVGSGLGYNLSSIQSIASWAGDGYGNQAYTVEVKLVGSEVFTLIATTSNIPFDAKKPTNCGATKTTLTDTSGSLAKGVRFIRFTAIGAGAASNGTTVFREIDVMGVATVP